MNSNALALVALVALAASKARVVSDFIMMGSWQVRRLCNSSVFVRKGV